MVCGCALRFVDVAAPDATSTKDATVVAGRINYIVDGADKAPYGNFRPSWPAPRLTALRLETGDPFASPEVAAADGAFRWRLPAGAYLVSRIGFGTLGDDTSLAWPGVVICVPPLEHGILYVGHLRLNGVTRVENTTLSSGRNITLRSVRYSLYVADERGPEAAGQTVVRRLMQVRPDMPTGDRLQQRWLEDRAALVRDACGKALEG